MAASDNLLVRLRKWVHRQDENFQTEAFAHLLEYLLANESEAAVQFLRELTAGILDLRPEEVASVRVSTQVTTEEGRPDVEIRAPQRLVYIEAKVESEPHEGQLEGYRKELNRSGVAKTGLILLSRYWVELGDEAEKPDAYVRWFEVADWLSQVSIAKPVSNHVVEQFVGFLRARGMTMEQVTRELTRGGPALHHLLVMVNDVLTRMGLRPQPYFYFPPGDIGFYAEDHRYWVGLTLSEPQYLSAGTWKFKADKDRVEQLGLVDGLRESQWPNETLGPHYWRKRVDLEAEEVHFFERTKASQVQFVEELLKDVFQTVKNFEDKQATDPELPFFQGQ
jgi:hypothetical protein